MVRAAGPPDEDQHSLHGPEADAFSDVQPAERRRGPGRRSAARATTPCSCSSVADRRARDQHVVMRTLTRVDRRTDAMSGCAWARTGTLWRLIDGDGAVAAEETDDQRSSHTGHIHPARTRSRRRSRARNRSTFAASASGRRRGRRSPAESRGRQRGPAPLSLTDGLVGPPTAERKRLSGPIEERHQGPAADRWCRCQRLPPRRLRRSVLEQSWQGAPRVYSRRARALYRPRPIFPKLIVRVEGERDGYASSWSTSTHTARSRSVTSTRGSCGPSRCAVSPDAAADGPRARGTSPCPRGKPAQKLRRQVLPDGRRAVRDVVDFDRWSQALADQGDAVLGCRLIGPETDRPVHEQRLRPVVQMVDRPVRRSR